MQYNTHSDSLSAPQSGSVVTRARPAQQDDTAQPSLTSGFGAVIGKEQDIRGATEGLFGQVSGQRSADRDRILRHQHSRMGANIALLEQRYEALPKPQRFVNWTEHNRPSAKRARMPRAETGLPDLIAQHTHLLADIQTLIDRAPDGQRGELILSEVGRSHEEMAWVLAALQNDDDSVRRIAAGRGSDGSGSTGRAQENWDNEGGPARIDPRTES
jgi:hypothetical protein